MWHRGVEVTGLLHFRIPGGMVSGPVLLLGFRSLIISLISSTVTGDKVNGIPGLLVRLSTNDS